MNRRNGWHLRSILKRGLRSLFFKSGRRRFSAGATGALCIFSVLVIAVVAMAPWGCSPNSGPTQFTTLESRIIRVRLHTDLAQVNVTASAAPIFYTMADPAQHTLTLAPNTPATISLTQSGWQCGRANLGRGELVLRPATIGSLAVEGVPHRGQYRLVPSSGNRFDVINDVELDDYLKSVVSAELYANWQENTYRAQAIVARTYALYEKYSPSEPRSWDVWGSTLSQAYGGLPAETAKSIAAVDATRGLVLASGPAGQERIFKAFFSSCCGGVSQNVTDAFPNEPYASPLVAQRIGPVCSISNRFNWGPVIITKDELTRRLKKRHPEMALVQTVAIQARNAFGRPTVYSVVDAMGRRYAWNCEDFRVDANTNSTPATYFYSSFVENVVNDSDRIRFIGGHGFGHGVGMCQWCAEARARAGVSAEDIVLISYPGAKLVRAY